MSALPRSIGSRLLPAALRPSATRAIAPKYRTYASKENAPETSPSDAPNAPLTQSSLDTRQNSSQAMAHKPDYDVAVDYRTS